MAQDVKFKIIDVGHFFHLLPCDTFGYTSKLLFGINSNDYFHVGTPSLANEHMDEICMCVHGL
jgi:hypothetical protein